MMKLTHEEYIEKERAAVVQVAKKIIAETVDVTEGCRFIYSVWEEAELSKENCDYGFFAHLEDELEAFPKGEER